MSTNAAPVAAGSGSGQETAPYRSQRSPEQPRGKSKRTLIESACTACQKRKSRCDGHRPSCSRCQALHTDCSYNAEEGESRWSALRRKNQILEKERDDARELLALMQSQPEPEALGIFCRVRSASRKGDLGVLMQEVRESTSGGPLLQQQHAHRNAQHHQHQHQHLHQHQPPPLSPPQHEQQPRQHQHQHQPSAFSQLSPNPTLAGLVNQLPPLRSVVEMPPVSGSGGAAQPGQQPRPQLFAPVGSTQRHSSMASGVSTRSYSSLSSSEGHTHSPRDDSPTNWTQGLG